MFVTTWAVNVGLFNVLAVKSASASAESRPRLTSCAGLVMTTKLTSQLVASRRRLLLGFKVSPVTLETPNFRLEAIDSLKASESKVFGLDGKLSSMLTLA